jgi:hypothetical protein
MGLVRLSISMISVLFVEKNSIYKTIPGLDCWDADRNALNWPGGNPGIFHPPCRLFCQLSHMSTAPIEEKKLAHWSIDMVRQWSGVLEHPAYSKLWNERGLPRPGKEDEYGFTYGLDQYWFGNRARKRTWLYICGIDKMDLPEVPLRFGNPEDIFAGGTHKRPHPTNSRHSGARSGTPLAFANWLIELVNRIPQTCNN